MHTWEMQGALNKRPSVSSVHFMTTGDGSVQTSVEDLLRWDENFYSAKIGGADVIRQMQAVGKLNSGEINSESVALRALDVLLDGHV
jgi:hypothetical protein